MRHSAMLRIDAVIISEQVAEKLIVKHHLESEEAYEVFIEAPAYRFFEKGDQEGEDLWAALGPTEAGRYVIVFFIYKKTYEALVVSARDMTETERRWYGRRS